MSQKDEALAMLAGGETRRASEFKAMGITGIVLTRLVRSGDIEMPQRGVYRIAGPAGKLADIRIGELGARYPAATICLMTALRHYGMTDDRESPDTLAFPHSSPVTVGADVRIYRWGLEGFHSNGVETRSIGGREVNITGRARTVADAFRMQNAFPLEHARKAFVTFVKEGGAPEEVARIARNLGFHKDLGSAVETARGMLDDGAFSNDSFDPDDFRF